MKPSEGKAIINSVLKKGWVRDGDKIYTPAQAAELGITNKAKRKKRASHIKTGWIDDTRNKKNKEAITDMFDRLVMIELNLEVWNEFYFSVDRLYRFDKAIPVKWSNSTTLELKIAIEINGGIWAKGNSGHSSGTGIKRDMDKSNLAQSLGWNVISVTPSDIQNNPGHVLELIKQIINNKHN